MRRGSSRVAFARVGLVLAAFVLAANIGWGSYSACAGAAKRNKLGAYTQSTPGTGCSVTDASFENMSLANPVGTGTFTAQTTSTDDIYATSTAASGNTVGPVNFFFDPAAAADWEVTAGTSTEGATINYNAIAHTSGVAPFAPAPTSAGYSWLFDSIILLPTATISAGGGNTITITEVFCLGATTTVGCAAADKGTITAKYTNNSTVAYTCAFGSAGCVSGTSNTVDLSAALQTGTIAISETYLLSRTGSTGNLTLTDIKDTFGEDAESPEPSTFVLLGTALAAVGLLRFRAPDRRSWFSAARSKGIMKRVLCVLGGLIAAGVSTNATTTFSSTGAIDLTSPPASIDPASIDRAPIDEDALEGDTDLLLFIFAETDPDLPGNSLTVDTDGTNPYTPDTYTSEPSDPSAVAEGVKFVTYFLHRDM